MRYVAVKDIKQGELAGVYVAIDDIKKGEPVDIDFRRKVVRRSKVNEGEAESYSRAEAAFMQGVPHEQFDEDLPVVNDMTDEAQDELFNEAMSKGD